MSKFEIFSKYKEEYDYYKGYYDFFDGDVRVEDTYESLHKLAEGLDFLSEFKFGILLNRIERAKPYIYISRDYLKTCFKVMECYFNVVEDDLKMEFVADVLNVEEA